MLYFEVLQWLAILAMSSSRVKLTETFIDQLEMTPTIFRDSELIGFAIRVNLTCKTYIVEKKVSGKTVRSTIGLHGNLTSIQARNIAQSKLSEMRQGIHPNTIKRTATLNENVKTDLPKNKPTLEQAFQNYLSHKKLKQRTLHDYTIVIDRYLQDWKSYKIDAISPRMIQAKHTHLSLQSKSQANMAMRVFRAIYNYSIEHYLDKNDQPILNTLNPVTILNRKNSWNKIRLRKNHLNQDQISAWTKAVFEYQDRGQKNHTNRDFLLTLVLTGFRREECESLSWSSIDLKNGWIHLRDPNSRKTHSLPMGDFLFSLMRKRRAHITCKWVFPSVKSETGHISNISKVCQKISALSGIEFNFQDLRRTFSIIAETLDNDPHTMNNLLKHQSEDDQNINSDHLKISEQNLREILNRIENIVLGEYKIKEM